LGRRFGRAFSALVSRKLSCGDYEMAKTSPLNGLILCRVWGPENLGMVGKNSYLEAYTYLTRVSPTPGKHLSDKVF